jgi:hypothetical protein
MHTNNKKETTLSNDAQNDSAANINIITTAMKIIIDFPLYDLLLQRQS